MAASVDGGRLDISDRLFNSIPNMWKNLLSDKNDVRELTPEFFSGHGGFLVNHLQVPLSDRSGGRPADNVELPAWARGWRFVALDPPAVMVVSFSSSVLCPSPLSLQTPLTLC